MYALNLQLVGKPVVDFLFDFLFRCLIRLRRYKRKSVVGIFRRGGSIWAQISHGRDGPSPTTVGVRKLECLPFRVVSKHPQYIVLFFHKARVLHTDIQTELRLAVKISWHVIILKHSAGFVLNVQKIFLKHTETLQTVSEVQAQKRHKWVQRSS